MLRVHDGEPVDIGEPVLGHALLGLAQHRRREIDADEPVAPGIFGQRQAGADTDFEDAAADALGRGDRGLAAAIEHRTEHEIVDRRPARIGFGDRGLVELSRHQRAAAMAPAAPWVFAAATVLAIMPPPSTRAWPSAAS